MFQNFKDHIEKFTKISDEDFSEITSFFSLQQVKKKENLLIEGKICKYHYFVLRGCLRRFFVNEKGVEQTTEFALENWWITDLFAFEQQRATEYYIQAVENSEVLRIDHASQEHLFLRFPIMEHYFRLIYQRGYAASQRRIKYIYEFSKEEMYHYFNTNYPKFVQRIPQHLIASFLGLTPEYLSEIRKNNRT